MSRLQLIDRQGSNYHLEILSGRIGLGDNLLVEGDTVYQLGTIVQIEDAKNEAKAPCQVKVVLKELYPSSLHEHACRLLEPGAILFSHWG